jgi:hypothetical protein
MINVIKNTTSETLKSFTSFARFTLITSLLLCGAGVTSMQAQQAATAGNDMVSEADTNQNSFAWLQLEEQHLDRVIANFAHALHSENKGVREAAIFHSFLLQLHFPDKQMNKLENAMFELTQTEREPRIRHKASIALYFFQDSSAELREELDKVPDGSRTESRLYQQALEVMNGRLFSDSSSSGLSF